MRPSRVLTALILAAACTTAGAADVENIRLWSENGRTRVVLDLSSPSRHNIFTLRNPDRIVVDLENGQLAESFGRPPDASGAVRAIRTGRRANGQLRVVIDLEQAVRSRSFTAGPSASAGDRLVIDLFRGGLKPVKSVASTERDVIVVIDPGHGGHDPGAIGRARTREKQVALAVGLKLANRINNEPGMRAVLTRSDDRYIDHRERFEIARRASADLFISVHADAVDDPRAKGASVYALSLKGASDEAAMRLAKRENTSLVGGVSLEDKDEMLASVLLDLSQNAAIGASLEVGDAIISQLAGVGSVHRRKVQQAGFLMLKSPDVPSVLVELNFISNPGEERKLTDGGHQARLADAILAGVRHYFYVNPPVDSVIAANLRRNPARTVRHVIRRGDTLSEIAERYNVSSSAIRAANKLSGNTIRVGQTLTIPGYTGG